MIRRTLSDQLEQEIRGLEREVSYILDVITLHYEHRYKPWRPPIDIYETDSAVIVKAEIAGIKLDDFNISFSDHVLTICGRRKDTEAKLNYHCLEIPYGEFQVRIFIPNVNDNFTTRYENGYLYVALPKTK
ncbi:hypothetical protein EP47_01340 [Legionella norrlandica]|uniref:SHSP domain-containing protein n=1 Tax=Legionella norrlandica TaxID=1498499 RepID=A0A0A2T566_9GAMM|nr:Hsp20/alpha crystallin family protein [Legionella norrlandica]KGP62578.1 hypothetical protein EP47_01340 [Legionella norrlandica]